MSPTAASARRAAAGTRLPQDIGPIHFVGIGGIGMSGIAEVMLNLGYDVQGSDLRDGPILERLRKLGARIAIGQRAENLDGAEVVVISSAIKPGNPELDAARARGLPVVRRAEMLAELMRLRSNVAVAGTHGKTTTTSMVAALLDRGGLDPTVINGGVIHAYGSNARLGAGEWMVVEADESDGTFVKLPATLAIVTNIDPEHLDHYGDFDGVRAAFEQFVSNLPFYGAAICCIDHPEVQSLVGRVDDRRVVTYGFSLQADVCGVNLRYVDGAARFDVIARAGRGVRAGAHERRLEGLTLPMPGDHNVQNALAAIAVALELGLSDDAIREGLAGFGGVNRRFTRAGSWNGVTVIDDYAHHPVEIAAVLRAARQATRGRVIAVHQPHRYSRLSSLFEQFCKCFNDADVAAIADVYPAGEAPIAGADRDALVAGLRAHGHRCAVALESPEALPDLVRAHAAPGDLVVCLGAGSITQWAHELAERLAQGGDSAPDPAPDPAPGADHDPGAAADAAQG
ncbi:UDP-N-acetylmuramate--L-alanine ligase [Oceanicella actignis]|uniref:UDP-N-acetylmuramate--L-alanine ligase n=1 Tax=Oceanicella actignis TaxID=1189325 RepID=A0A1M7SB38_9RHOB|nr:UDP-N-acetylmuramate--L-alanine ligase [Oceanicella actignis]SET28485.1 UDP-N-acetylmuramate--L-alanine ligase [Oceanicella actignis]SHN55665.1 UDP-N-acetylmuramate--L-alanine ligase [Oceanicella actignis]